MNVNVTYSSSSVLPLKWLLFSFWSKFKGRWSRKQRRKALSSSSNRYTKITFIYREANYKKDLKTSRKGFSCPKEGTTARWLGGWWCCVAGTRTPWSVTHKREVYHNYRSFLRSMSTSPAYKCCMRKTRPSSSPFETQRGLYLGELEGRGKQLLCSWRVCTKSPTLHLAEQRK